MAKEPRRGRGGSPGCTFLGSQPDAPEDRALGDAGRRLPGGGSAHRPELALAVGQGDGHGVGLRVLGLRQGELQPALGLFEVFGADRGELGAAQRAGEAGQDQGAIVQAAQVAGMGTRIWRRMAAVAATFLAGSSPHRAASRRIPATVSETQASSVGTGQPAARCR